MYLSSFTFTAILLPVLLLGYYFLPDRARPGFLLGCSVVIYGWGVPSRLLYPAAMIFYDYGIGLLLERMRHRRMLCGGLLTLSVVLQSVVLTWVRYDLQTDGAGGFFPFGIAICMLQGLGYLIGIFRRVHPAETHFGRLTLYLMLFPLLYAGPVLSYADFTKQLRHRRCDLVHLSEGLGMFIRGLAEKVVLADTFGYLFRELRRTEQMSMLTAWLMALAFSMYLYFELIGCAEMARGLGACFGLHLPKNFRHPFSQPTVTAFMQGYLITVQNWFRTNFYEPLFGGRKPVLRGIGMLLMWMLTGMWLGTHLQCLLWGLAVGILLLLENLGLGRFFRKRYVLGVVWTMLMTQLVWVLLFAENMTEAGTVWRAMLGFGNGIADRYGIYFFTSYITLLLFGLYIAADMFRILSERITIVRPGRIQLIWKPLLQGILLIFCLASMLYGEREGLWLKL